MGLEQIITARDLKNPHTRPVGPHVSIYTGGTLHFNVAALLQFPELRRKWAAVYVDRETHQIGILCTDDERLTGLLKIGICGNHNPYPSINARRAFMRLGYFPTRKCATPLAKQDELLLFTVPHEVRPSDGQQQ